MECDSARSLEDEVPTTDDTSAIAEFFNGRSVFITGAAGYVGSVLLEALLRCCPGISSIYILLREKKGIPAVSRKAFIFQKRIFQSLKSKNSKVFEKVHVISGDITSVDLGISSSIMEEISEYISVVFHCAAAISFSKTLRYMITQNVIGMENLIAFCRKLKNLEALVHTSTAYSNCNRHDSIKEEVYRFTVPARNFVNAVHSNADDVVLSEMQMECVPAWPNTYVFTKAMAEDLLETEASDFPIAIVRPSIIISTWKGSMPGYTEEGAGVIDVSLGIGKGFIRVLYCDEDKIVDIVPVDGVANTLICAAWTIATKRLTSPLVVNCTSGEVSPCTWGNFIRTLFVMTTNNPLPKMYQKPSIVMRKHRTTYWISAIVNHYAPALAIDFLLLALRKKPKLTKLYRFYDMSLNYLSYFLLNEWHFQSENFKKLGELQNTKDKDLFPVDLRSFSIKTISNNIRHGAPFYQWEIDSKPCKDRIPLAYRRYVLTSFIKWMVIAWFLIFVALIVTKGILRDTAFN